jgi:hypothetical protein
MWCFAQPNEQNLVEAAISSADAEVGDGRRIGGAKGDLDLLVGARPDFLGCGVFVVGKVDSPIEENTGGIPRGAIVGGARLGGGGQGRSRHSGWMEEAKEDPAIASGSRIWEAGLGPPA